MTTIAAPKRMGQSAPHRRLDRRTTLVLAALMPAGPLCVAALRGLMPTFSSDTATSVATAVSASPARQSAVVWLGYVATLLLVPGVIAVGGMTREASPRLTRWALAFVVPGYLSLGALVSSDAMLWSAHDAGLSTSATAALYDHQHPALLVGAAVFVLGHVVGTVLLGLALLKSQRVPSVFAWALTVSQPLHFVAFVVLGLQPLDVFAWGLTTVAMGAAAWALVQRPGQSMESST